MNQKNNFQLIFPSFALCAGMIGLVLFFNPSYSPKNFLDIPFSSYGILFPLLLILGGFIWFWLKPESSSDEEIWIDKNWHWIVTSLIALKFFLLIFIHKEGFIFLTTDDYCRLVISHQFSREPFIGPWDHIWLGGQFYIIGSLLKWIHDPVVASRIVSLGFDSLTLLVILFGVRRLVGSWVALGIGIWFVLDTGFTWLSLSVFPEVIFNFFILLGALSWLQRDRKPNKILETALWFSLSETLRFEGWLFGGILFLWLIWEAFKNRKNKKILFVILISFFCLAFYPLLWFWDTWRVHGNPTFFLEESRRIFAVGSMAGEGWFWKRFLFYPSQFWKGDPFFSLAALLSVFALFKKGKQPQWIWEFIIFAGVEFVLLILLLVKTGVAPGVLPLRTITTTKLLIMPVVGICLVQVLKNLGGKNSFSKWCLGVGLTAGLLIGAIQNVVHSFHFPRSSGISPEAVELGETLHEMIQLNIIDEKNLGGVLIEPGEVLGDIWALQVLSRHPEWFQYLSDFYAVPIEGLLDKGRPMLVIAEKKEIDDPYFQYIRRKGDYQIYLWNLPLDPVRFPRIKDYLKKEVPGS